MLRRRNIHARLDALESRIPANLGRLVIVCAGSGLDKPDLKSLSREAIEKFVADGRASLRGNVLMLKGPEYSSVDEWLAVYRPR